MKNKNTLTERQIKNRIKKISERSLMISEITEFLFRSSTSGNMTYGECQEWAVRITYDPHMKKDKIDFLKMYPNK